MAPSLAALTVDHLVLTFESKFFKAFGVPNLVTDRAELLRFSFPVAVRAEVKVLGPLTSLLFASNFGATSVALHANLTLELNLFSVQIIGRC